MATLPQTQSDTTMSTPFTGARIFTHTRVFSVPSCIKFMAHTFAGYNIDLWGEVQLVSHFAST